MTVIHIIIGMFNRPLSQRLYRCDRVIIHVNPERSFRGTNDGPSSEARWALKGGGSGGPPPEI